ncbi:hypothetical protein [Wolbachia endosymbiont (group A) of Agelastica alni]|uniref:hypothetical protein n=2 Tax=Wolbachia TaxID=953 RepID=UPI00333E2731
MIALWIKLSKNNATEHQKLDYMDDRNAAVRLIKSYDCIKKWKEEVNYGKRAHIEGFFSRSKQIFGFSFRNKSEINREKELNAICSINSLILVWLNLR